MECGEVAWGGMHGVETAASTKSLQTKLPLQMPRTQSYTEECEPARVGILYCCMCRENVPITRLLCWASAPARRRTCVCTVFFASCARVWCMGGVVCWKRLRRQ